MSDPQPSDGPARDFYDEDYRDWLNANPKAATNSREWTIALEAARLLFDGNARDIEQHAQIILYAIGRAIAGKDEQIRVLSTGIDDLNKLHQRQLAAANERAEKAEEKLLNGKLRWGRERDQLRQQLADEQERHAQLQARCRELADLHELITMLDKLRQQLKDAK